MPPARPEWFGSSGIRGPLDRVDSELGMRLGRALGSDRGTIIVASDARRSGPALKEAVIAGILASGADVRDAGMLPTPALAHTVRKTGARYGVMVTASHNPSADNGYKVWGPTGSALSEDALLRLETRMRDAPPRARWDGTGTRSDHGEALAHYLDDVLEHLDGHGFEEGTLDGHRIAIDCAHGTGALATPILLSRLGANLTVLGGNPDGAFPDHPSEPTAKHLEGLRQVLAAGGHDLGIAHDGDADRTIFLDPAGRIVSMERLLVVLARRRGDDTIAVPVDAGGLLRRALPDAHIETTPVGDVHLSRAIEDQRATLGAEPSGTWFFADWSPAPEGPYAACLVAGMLAHDPELLDEAMGLPTPIAIQTKHEVQPEVDRIRLAADAGTILAAKIAHERITVVDGVRLDTADGWVLVRASGTEPIVRVAVEATTRENAETLAREAREALAAAAERAPRGGAA